VWMARGRRKHLPASRLQLFLDAPFEVRPAAKRHRFGARNRAREVGVSLLSHPADLTVSATASAFDEPCEGAPCKNTHFHGLMCSRFGHNQ
jgi:hypothetical protein